MWALDCFCCSGGVARGFMQAGFYVVGVDIEDQPNYCGDEFIQMDVLEYLKTEDLSRFVYIHASPPCKFFTELKHSFEVKKHDIDLITPTRPLLEASGLPWTIENVPQSRRALRDPITVLCGSMFPGLETETHQLRRHRLFEASGFQLAAPSACNHHGKVGKPVGGVYGAHGRDRRRPQEGAQNPEHVSGSNLSWEDQFALMGVPAGTMRLIELSEAIPPPYAYYIAKRLINQRGWEIEEREPSVRIVSAPPASRGQALEADEDPGLDPSVLRPVVAYCVTLEDARTLVAEMIDDAAGHPVALDIETAPLAAEADRFKALSSEHAAAKGRLKAAKKVKAPLPDLEALAAETKRLEARTKYAGAAALDPYRSRIRLVQLYGGGQRASLVDVFRTGDEALALLNGLDVVIHNAAFDLEHLEARGVELGEVHCTMQAARLTLGERAMDLKTTARSYLDVDLDKNAQTSDWSAPSLTSEQLNYAADDAVAVWHVASKIFPTLGWQTSAYEIQVAATPAAARMKHRGFKLDLAAHADLMVALKVKRMTACEAYRLACVEAGQPQLAAKVPATPTEKQAALTAILDSDELMQWKRTPKSGALSTARSDLKRAAHYPPIEALVELSRIDKILSAFGPTLAELVSPVTGRIHASYLIAATASGRAACSKPNLQQAPRDKAFRALFKAAEGCVLVGADYSSMELRAVAHISNERRMTEAFENGEDLHRLTASVIARKPVEEVTDEERRAAKPVNFGAVYGMGAPGLIATAWDEYGIAISHAEAAEWLNAFEKAYPDFIRWRRQHTVLCEMRKCIVIGRDAARGIGRHYPLERLPEGKNVYTRACNLPVQGVCADCSMLALTAIDRRLFEEEIDGGPVAWLHDEIILEVPEQDAGRAAELLKRAMVEAFAETFPGAPLANLVEARIGADWAAVKG
jgi:DNA polymerase-1